MKKMEDFLVETGKKDVDIDKLCTVYEEYRKFATVEYGLHSMDWVENQCGFTVTPLPSPIKGACEKCSKQHELTHVLTFSEKKTGKLTRMVLNEKCRDEALIAFESVIIPERYLIYFLSNRKEKNVVRIIEDLKNSTDLCSPIDHPDYKPSDNKYTAFDHQLFKMDTIPAFQTLALPSSRDRLTAIVREYQQKDNGECSDEKIPLGDEFTLPLPVPDATRNKEQFEFALATIQKQSDEIVSKNRKLQENIVILENIKKRKREHYESQIKKYNMSSNEYLAKSDMINNEHRRKLL